jgi:hypothetical protein
VSIGTKITGDRRATTLPVSIGLLAYVEATERLPLSLFAVTNHAVREQNSPKIGVAVAATTFCRFHMRVRVAGMTAEDTITPIIRYKYVIDIPI